VHSTKLLLRGNGDFPPDLVSRVISGQDPRRRMLALGLTTKPGCDYNCVYCYTSGGREEYARIIPPDQWMTLPEYEKAIAQSARLGARTVALAGVGETLMDPDIKPILTSISSQGMTPFLFTNISTHVDQAMAEFLYANHVTLFIKLDSLERETYSWMTGRDRLPDVLAGIDLLVNRGYGQIRTENGFTTTDIGINMMVTDRNAGEVGRLAAFAQERNMLFHAQVPGRAGSADVNYQDICGSPARNAALRALAAQYSDQEEILITEHGCLFWVGGIIIGLDGTARLCPVKENDRSLGSIRTMDLADIITRRNEQYPLTDGKFCPLHTRE
jgi:MoaA/NifB/PqqE/SkfB family radical SAM enzyme